MRRIALIAALAVLFAPGSGARAQIAVNTIVSNPLLGPQGIALGANGNIYVANNGNNSLAVVSPSGAVSVLASGLNQPTAVALDPSGNIYVANTGDSTIVQQPLSPFGKSGHRMRQSWAGKPPFIIASFA